MGTFASVVAVPVGALAVAALLAVSAGACSGGSSLADVGDADATATGEGGSSSGDASGSADSGKDASDSGGNLGRVPAVHRAAAVECSHVRGAGNFDPTLMFAACKSDAECAGGGYCSPSVDPDKTNYGITGWWCHTAADSCIDDADCATDGGPVAKCAYDPGNTHWSCSSQEFLPP